MTIAQTDVLAPAGTWSLDPVHSVVSFEVSYLAGTFKGQFRDVDARLQAGEEETTLTGRAIVASVDVKDENLAAHLQSPDFFDAERHPELTFVSHAIEPTGDDGAVGGNGEVTIKGVTHSVELTGTRTDPIIDPYGNQRLGLALTATVDRTAFGVDWNNPLPSGEPALGDEVTILAELQFVKAA
jgi:polyisoprenoid-binding protein YceI